MTFNRKTDITSQRHGPHPDPEERVLPTALELRRIVERPQTRVNVRAIVEEVLAEQSGLDTPLERRGILARIIRKTGEPE